MILKNSPTEALLDVEAVRRDFPILQSSVCGKPLVYLDNAASAQKPQSVIDRLDRYYKEQNANIHRGVHFLSQEATVAYEDARKVVARFINAAEPKECIFTRNATEAVNLVASSWGRANLKAGDEIIISTMEHHANIVPWQMLRDELGVVIKVVPISDTGEFLVEDYKALFTAKTKLAALCQVSNSLGTINPAKVMVEIAHQQGVPVLLDGAQAIAHLPIDVQDLDCDFYVFSGHKLFGPTGIGVLYGKADLLSAMPPYQGGGDMIDRVTFEKTTYRGIPERFEAGTPHISGAIGLATAIEYVEQLGHEAMIAHEQSLLKEATDKLLEIPGLRIYGTAGDKVSVISFTMDGIHPNDAGTILDADGIAVRTGHHCTMPLWQRFGLEGSIRASFAFYNTREEIDLLVTGLGKVQKLLG
ncbi:cysteine desulfurase [Rubellicoccus peritrichatus]|uniref:Cysteine desulfurase n=1 Tax=Rubellicoccus peritrichatus TaxID=3080537 RepID=A0AAQ3LGG8_9BACT|nr:cysteine desulfurase [Puniceicoccus sp. CR14]WOO43378.1 cysteine desulfurase [Puniceicoccus sp. CR14]